MAQDFEPARDPRHESRRERGLEGRGPASRRQVVGSELGHSGQDNREQHRSELEDRSGQDGDHRSDRDRPRQEGGRRRHGADPDQRGDRQRVPADRVQPHGHASGLETRDPEAESESVAHRRAPGGAGQEDAETAQRRGRCGPDCC